MAPTSHQDRREVAIGRFGIRNRAPGAAAPSTAHLAYPVIEGLDLPGCAFCRQAARREQDAAWSFLWEGKHAPEVRAAIRAAGGFCGRHAELVLAVALREDLTAGLAEVYEHLIAGDVARVGPAPAARCPLCVARADSEARMAAFVAERLGSDGDARAAYRRSAGFCLPHLRLVLARADAPTRHELRVDVDARLQALSHRLAEYRRKRDYRNSAEPKGDEQVAAIEATRLYSGEARMPPIPPAAGDRDHTPAVIARNDPAPPAA